MKTHPAATIFPLLKGAALDSLVTDIRANGLREAIWRDRSGRILDGRNRLRACKEAKVKPRFQTYEGDDVVSFVISLNLHRRHLDESQRAMAAARLANLTDGQRADYAGASNEAPAITQPEAAGRLNVSRASVQRAARVLANCDERLVAEVDYGSVKVTDAAAIFRERPRMQRALLGRVIAGKAPTLQAAMRQRDLARQIRAIESGQFTPPDQYDVIVFDPPWETMSREELEELNINFYASANSVLWIWTTHRHITGPFFLMMRWIFEPQFVLTWVKDRVGQRPKKTEFCIMGTSGSPKFNSTNPTTVIEAPARQKNGKPDEFYEMVDSYCVGSKLDYFARKERDGWARGNDVSKPRPPHDR